MRLSSHLQNGGLHQHAQQMAAHESARESSWRAQLDPDSPGLNREWGFRRGDEM